MNTNLYSASASSGEGKSTESGVSLTTVKSTETNTVLNVARKRQREMLDRLVTRIREASHNVRARKYAETSSTGPNVQENTALGANDPDAMLAYGRERYADGWSDATLAVSLYAALESAALADDAAQLAAYVEAMAI